jgi:hypothetical protein
MPIPKVESGESQNDYVGKCMHAIASEYDTNEQAVAICINTYEKTNMSKSTEQRVAQKMAGIRLIFEAQEADKIISELAAKGEASYPWDQCIEDQTKQYGDKDTAEKVCGYIKSTYGH